MTVYPVNCVCVWGECMTAYIGHVCVHAYVDEHGCECKTNFGVITR